MDRDDAISNLVAQWIKIAERDLLTARQGMDAAEIVTETVCYHLQQTAEKYLKAYLVKHQVEFSKSHNIRYLLNLCSTIDPGTKRDVVIYLSIEPLAEGVGPRICQ